MERVGVFAGLADAQVWRASGFLGGHGLMHELPATGDSVCCLARRRGVAFAATGVDFAGRVNPTQDLVEYVIVMRHVHMGDAGQVAVVCAGQGAGGCWR